MKRPMGTLTACLGVLALGACASADAEDAVQQEFTSMQMQGVAPAGVEVDAQAAAQRLSTGITFATISNQDRDEFDEDAFTGYHAFLAESYPLVHRTLRKEVLGDPRAYSLLYTWEGADPSLPPVVLMAHQDVVPVPPETSDQWDQDPFSGAIADGYVWGRGSLDDKLMVQAILEAVEMQLAEDFQPRRTIYLAFGQDEEVGGPEGVAHIVDVLAERGIDEIALILDEAAPLAPGLFPGIPDNTALIGTAEKGYLSLQLTANEVGGHSAMPPPQGNIGILAQAVTRLEENPFPYRITQTVRDQYRYLGPELPEDTHDMFRAVAFGTDDEVTELEQAFIDMMIANPITAAMLHTTTAVTMFDAGIKDNVLPPSASAVVNFRILQGETVQSVTERVRELIDDPRITLTDISASIDPSNISDAYGDEYRLIERTIRQTWGNDLLVSPFIVVGGADAKHFAARPMAPNVYRFTAVQVETAADQQRWHGVNERVLIEEFGRSISFFHQFITNLEEF